MPKILVLYKDYGLLQQDEGINPTNLAMTRGLESNGFDVTNGFLVVKEKIILESKNIKKNKEQNIYFDFTNKDLKGLKRILAAYKLYQFLKNSDFEYIITHRYKPFFMVALFSNKLITFKKNLKIVSYFHGDVKFSFFRRLFNHYFAKNIKLVTVSNWAKDKLQGASSAFVKNNVYVLPNSIDKKLVENQIYSKEYSKELFNIPKDSYVIGTIARLVSSKDPEVLINGFAKFYKNSTNKNTYLVIIGDGYLKDNLMKYIDKLDCSDNIKLVGAYSNAFKYLKAFDLFCLTSKREACGLVILEAMAAGLPIISTRAGGIPEFLGKDYDWYINIGDSDKLTKLFSKMQSLSDEELEELKNHLRDRVENRFDYNNYFNKLSKLLK